MPSRDRPATRLRFAKRRSAPRGPAILPHAPVASLTARAPSPARGSPPGAQTKAANKAAEDAKRAEDFEKAQEKKRAQWGTDVAADLEIDQGKLKEALRKEEARGVGGAPPGCAAARSAAGRGAAA